MRSREVGRKALSVGGREKNFKSCHSERSEESAFVCFQRVKCGCFASFSKTDDFFTPPWREGVPLPAFSSARRLTGTGEGSVPAVGANIVGWAAERHLVLVTFRGMLQRSKKQRNRDNPSALSDSLFRIFRLTSHGPMIAYINGLLETLCRRPAAECAAANRKPESPWQGGKSGRYKK